jgi:pimeloyl-ACP methyl ester carboxylesterase
MTYFLVALAVISTLAAGVLWWGSNIVFHPPKMLPHIVWPEQFGLAYVPVSFRTSDGLKLRGWLIPAERATDRTILCCHGWGDNKGDLLKRIHFLAKGFNLFLFDSRSHGESDGEITTIGVLERRDFDSALAFLRKERPSWGVRLGLFGLSMGAVMAVRGMADHAELLCAALETPFVSFGRIVTSFTRRKYRLSYFPFVWAVLKLIRWRIGEDPELCSPRLHAHKLRGRPAFLVTGELDGLIPPGELREFFESMPEPKEFWVVPEARHGLCWEAGGEEYRRRLFAFFDRNL